MHFPALARTWTQLLQSSILLNKRVHAERGFEEQALHEADAVEHEEGATHHSKALGERQSLWLYPSQQIESSQAARPMARQLTWHKHRVAI